MARHPNAKIQRAYEGLTKVDGRGVLQWTGAVQCLPERLEQPLRWRKPRRVFVNSMSDLFHQDVSDEFIDAVHHVMACAPHHVFQVLTKRPEQAASYYEDLRGLAIAAEVNSPPRGEIASLQWSMDRLVRTSAENIARDAGLREHHNAFWRRDHMSRWPLDNVWLGVSVESQDQMDRVDVLRTIPAAVRWISAEPLLGPLALDLEGIDWVVVGGESGPGARPVGLGWIRSIVEQCAEAGVACFVKQMGTASGWSGKEHKDPAYWPEGLRVREYPTQPGGRDAA